MTKQGMSQVKRQLSSFDICALSAELKGLVGSRVEKVFHYPASPMEIQLKLQTPTGKRELRIFVGNWLYLAETELKRPSEGTERLTAFAQILRKHISNAKITSVAQHGFDRIIEMGLEQGPQRYMFMVEMFASGNVVLVEGGVIAAVLTNMEMRDRTLKIGQKYSYPPSRADLTTISENDFTLALRQCSGSVVRALALELNMGGTYAEELCIRAGVEKGKKCADLTDEETVALYSSLGYLIDKCHKGGYGEIILSDSGQPIDLQPWSLRTYDKFQKTRAASFNDCVARYAEIVGTGRESDDAMKIELGRLKRKLEQQRSALPEIEEQEKSLRRTAEAMYSEIERFERSIILLRRAKEKKNLDSTAKLLVAQGAISSLDLANWRFTASIIVDGTPVNVNIDISKNFHENVALVYEKAKAQAEKLTGAKTAFEQTLREIDSLSKKALMKPSTGPHGRGSGRKQRHWFETFRWFVSSEGNIVVAGRDAGSNDRVVKKYLRDGDRYAHAEIHGAPSVVIRKSEGAAEIGKATLEQACEFALSFSKAWSMKLAHGSAYWVTPEQVSKTPQTGEFVPRGGFIIRGRKNFHESRVECAIGEIDYEDEKLLMCGPLSAIRARTKKYALLRPGEEDRNMLSKRLAALFGKSVDDIAPLLPPGDARIAETTGL